MADLPRTSRNFRELAYFLNYLKGKPMQTTETQLDLSTKQLAEVMGCTPRMVNIYRAAIEADTNLTIGYKSGKTTYFRSHEQRAIIAQRERGVDTQAVGAQAQARVSQPVTGATGEEGMNDGMAAIVAQSDQQAIAMGQMLGQRFNALMMNTMMGTIAQGFGEMQQTMTEVTASIQCSLPEAPALGAASGPFVLEAGADALKDVDYYGEPGSTAGNDD
jgi:hypothetical protein